MLQMGRGGGGLYASFFYFLFHLFFPFSIMTYLSSLVGIFYFALSVLSHWILYSYYVVCIPQLCDTKDHFSLTRSDPNMLLRSRIEKEKKYTEFIH